MTVLQSSCDDALRWLNAAVREARVLPANPGRDRAVTTLYCGGYRLKPFPRKSKPDVSGLTGPYKTLLCEYASLVNEWNMSVSRLLAWFPFSTEDYAFTGETKADADDDRTDHLSLVVCAPQDKNRMWANKT